MRLLLRWTGGLIIWAVGFNLLYGLHGIGCGAGWDNQPLGPLSAFRWLLLLGWLLPVAAGAWLVWRERHVRGSDDRLALVGAVIGVTATFATGVPVLFFPECV